MGRVYGKLSISTCISSSLKLTCINWTDISCISSEVENTILLYLLHKYELCPRRQNKASYLKTLSDFSKDCQKWQLYGFPVWHANVVFHFKWDIRLSAPIWHNHKGPRNTRKVVSNTAIDCLASNPSKQQKLLTIHCNQIFGSQCDPWTDQLIDSPANRITTNISTTFPRSNCMLFDWVCVFIWWPSLSCSCQW